MLLINSELQRSGCVVDFILTENPLKFMPEGDWPVFDDYVDLILFQFTDIMIETFCNVTQSYLPFPQYELTLYRKGEIYALASQFCLWQYQLMKTQTFYFKDAYSIYKSIKKDGDLNNISQEKMKHDLIETIHFIIGKLNMAAQSNKSLLIIGY